MLENASGGGLDGFLGEFLLRGEHLLLHLLRLFHHLLNVHGRLCGLDFGFEKFESFADEHPGGGNHQQFADCHGVHHAKSAIGESCLAEGDKDKHESGREDDRYYLDAGEPTGLARQPMEAKAFYAVICSATIVGMIMNFTPIDPIRALYWSAVINGVVAVPVMAIMMWLAAAPKVMGDFVITGWTKALGWVATAVMAVAVAAMLATS